MLSLPFYFFDFFSIKQNETTVVNTLRFWLVGLTGEYGDTQIYFHTRSPHFINGIVGALIFSLVAFIVYVVFQIVGASKSIQEKKYYIASFSLIALCNCFYLSAAICTSLLYSNTFHASYVEVGSAKIGIGAVIACLLQFAATSVSYLNLDKYVIAPYIKQREESKKQYLEYFDLQQQKHTYDTREKQYICKTGVTYNHNNISYNYEQKYYLVCYKGNMAGAKIELKNGTPIYIGRDAKKCAIVINENFKTVSRVHCCVFRKGSEFYVKPLSLNGVYYSDNKELMSVNKINKVEPNRAFNLSNTENEYYFKIKNFRKENLDESM